MPLVSRRYLGAGEARPHGDVWQGAPQQIQEGPPKEVARGFTRFFYRDDSFTDVVSAVREDETPTYQLQLIIQVSLLVAY